MLFAFFMRLYVRRVLKFQNIPPPMWVDAWQAKISSNPTLEQPARLMEISLTLLNVPADNYESTSTLRCSA